MVKPSGIVAFIVLSIVITFLIGIPTQPGKCVGFGSGIIRIQKINYPSGLIQALFIFDETTSSDSFIERSTTWITILTPRNTTEGRIIGRADPDWQLVGTNNVTIWHWMLQKSYDLESKSSYPNVFFPFEKFTIVFYVATNSTRQFSVTSEIPQFSVAITQRSVNYTEAPFVDQPEGCPYLQEIIIDIFHDIEYQSVAMILYALMVIILAMAILLWKRKETLGSSNYLMILLTILIFLPVFFFTLRNSIAPSYLTVPDWLCLTSMLVYGVLLIYEVEGGYFFKRRRRLPDYEPTNP